MKKQNWTFTFIGTDDLDVENIAMDMGIDNHLQFSEDEAGTKAMFARENRARERYNKCRAMDCKMEAGSSTPKSLPSLGIGDDNFSVSANFDTVVP